jgi:hypothetical protein
MSLSCRVVVNPPNPRPFWFIEHTSCRLPCCCHVSSQRSVEVPSAVVPPATSESTSEWFMMIAAGEAEEFGSGDKDAGGEPACFEFLVRYQIVDAPQRNAESLGSILT